jgi:hypothetical protein
MMAGLGSLEGEFSGDRHPISVSFVKAVMELVWFGLWSNRDYCVGHLGSVVLIWRRSVLRRFGGRMVLVFAALRICLFVFELV